MHQIAPATVINGHQRSITVLLQFIRCELQRMAMGHHCCEHEISLRLQLRCGELQSHGVLPHRFTHQLGIAAQVLIVEDK